jgi:hypothetical protein
VISWWRLHGMRVAGASVPAVCAASFASGSPRCSPFGSGSLERPVPITGLPAVIPAMAVRWVPTVRLRRGGSPSPYRPQAPSLLGDDPPAGAGQVSPFVRTVDHGCERTTDRGFRAGQPCLAGRALRAADSRSYRPHRGLQVVPGTGSYRSQTGTDLRRLGGSGGRGTTRQCSRRSTDKVPRAERLARWRPG